MNKLNTVSVSTPTLAPITTKEVVGIVSVTKKAKKTKKDDVPLSLDDKMIQHGKDYKRIATAAKKSLETFKDIGDTLLLIRKDFESDKLFGQHIATTPLATISRRDRADMQWLASSWELILEFKKENDYQGNSVQYLRTKVNDALKANAVDTEEEENEGSGEAGTDIVPKTLDIVELTEKVLALAEANSISTKALIIALQASLNT